jgi:hypothetical protein
MVVGRSLTLHVCALPVAGHCAYPARMPAAVSSFSLPVLTAQDTFPHFLNEDG